MSEEIKPYNLESAEKEAADMLDKIKGGVAVDYEEAESEAEIEKMRKRRELALKQWRNGHLGVTADDHWAIGGTPDGELRKNPGKTLGELWSVEKIKEYLESRISSLERARKEYAEKGPDHPEIHWSRDSILSSKQSLRSAIAYLKSIKKLPEEFANFEVEDLKNDPR